MSQQPDRGMPAPMPLACPRYHGDLLLRAHDSPLSMENAEFHSSCYRSSDLNLAAGCERIIFRPLQDRVEPSTSDADIASAKERERERILQQTSQRESVIIAFHPHAPHEIRQHP